jgi:starch phosphorylase
LRGAGYDPRQYYRNDGELREVLDMIGSGFFSPQDPQMFAPIVNALLDQGDYYMVLADFRSYVTAQQEVSRVFQNPAEWARRSILNVAQMGNFSSDRAVLEYASRIWSVQPLEGETVGNRR